MAHSTSLTGSAEDLNSILSHFPGGMHGRADSQHAVACCCGQDQCAYLAQNDAVLKGLEQDLESAAKIGQVCTTLSTSVHEVAFFIGDHVADICTAGSTGQA